MFSFARYMIFRDFEVIMGEPTEGVEPLGDESVTDMETADSEGESVEDSAQ